MSVPIPLTPCDYLTWMRHRVIEGCGQGGNIPYMTVEAEGHANPDAVRLAFQSALEAHPAIISGLRTSITTGRPYWRTPSERLLNTSAVSAALLNYQHIDLRLQPDWLAAYETHFTGHYVTTWQPRVGPQVRLEQYSLPGDQSRFVIRWPHFAMDAEGAQWFLSELDRVSNSSNPESPKELTPDHEVIDVLAAHSLRERLHLFRKGFSAIPEDRPFKMRPLATTPLGEIKYGVLHRLWDATTSTRILENVNKRAPYGPARHARFVAAAVFRALHDLYAARHIQTEALMITLPLRVTLRDKQDRPIRRRPLPGNYLVAPTICVARDRAGSWEAIGEDIQRQLKAYREASGDLAQWAMMWMASRLRASLYPLIFKLPSGFEKLCSGFSYYGEIAQPIRQLAGCRVTNVYGGGPLPVPPGINPVFSRFGDRLNLSLTWARPAIPDDLAQQYADLIERHLLDNSE